MIAITGKSGVGKTYILNILKEKGYKVFNTDEYVHHLYKKGNKGYEIIKNLFGNDVLKKNEVDREKLGNLILKYPYKIKEIEKKIYPLIGKKITQEKYDFIEIVKINSEFFNFKALFKICINLIKSNKELGINKDHKNISYNQKKLFNILNKGFYENYYVNIYIVGIKKIVNTLEEILLIYKNN